MAKSMVYLQSFFVYLGITQRVSGYCTFLYLSNFNYQITQIGRARINPNKSLLYKCNYVALDSHTLNLFESLEFTGFRVKLGK